MRTRGCRCRHWPGASRRCIMERLCQHCSANCGASYSEMHVNTHQAGCRCMATSGWPSQCLRALRGTLMRPCASAWGSYRARRPGQRAAIVGRGLRRAPCEARGQTPWLTELPLDAALHSHARCAAEQYGRPPIMGAARQLTQLVSAGVYSACSHYDRSGTAATHAMI